MQQQQSLARAAAAQEVGNSNNKEAKLMALNESNRALIRDVKNLLSADADTAPAGRSTSDEDAAASSRHHKDVLNTMWNRMRKLHNDQVNYLYEEMEENDKLWRTEVARRDVVIQQLRDAIEKLEVALDAMTRVATKATEAKKKATSDLAVLRRQIRLMEEAEARMQQTKAEKDVNTTCTGAEIREDDNMAHAAMAAEKAGIDLKARLSSKEEELKKLADTKEKELHEVQGAKALLSFQLHAKEEELEKEMQIKTRTDKENTVQTSRNDGWSVSTAAALSYLNNLFDPTPASNAKPSEGKCSKTTSSSSVDNVRSEEVTRKPLGSVN